MAVLSFMAAIMLCTTGQQPNSSQVLSSEHIELLCSHEMLQIDKSGEELIDSSTLPDGLIIEDDELNSTFSRFLSINSSESIISIEETDSPNTDSALLSEADTSNDTSSLRGKSFSSSSSSTATDLSSFDQEQSLSSFDQDFTLQSPGTTELHLLLLQNSLPQQEINRPRKKGDTDFPDLPPFTGFNIPPQLVGTPDIEPFKGPGTTELRLLLLQNSLPQQEINRPRKKGDTNFPDLPPFTGFNIPPQLVGTPDIEPFQGPSVNTTLVLPQQELQSLPRVEGVRLAGAGSQRTGRVEVFVDGVWGAICDTMFDDFDAMVVCSQFGYSDHAAAIRDGQFGFSRGPVHIDQLDCSGEEQDLSHCPRTNGTSCRTNHAAVTCFTRSVNIDIALSSLLPAECGKPLDPDKGTIIKLGKVRGGKPTRQFETPWLVSIVVPNKKNELRHICGGVILSSLYVLTAAHCFRRQGKDDARVRVGDHSRDFVEDSQQDFLIDELFIHEHFEETTRNENDISLIKVETQGGGGIRLDGRVGAVCLPPFIPAPPTDISNCIVTGWGKTGFGRPSANVPNRAELGLHHKAVCEAQYSDTITSGMLCAGRLDKPIGACAGDSGSPLTCQIGNRSVLLGLVSWGNPCSFKKFPGLLTRVQAYLRWILEKIGGNRAYLYGTD